MKTIFIACPVRYFSGGPELAHQLCHELLELGFTAKMFYYGPTNLIERWPEVYDSPYAKYNTLAAMSVEDD